MRSDAAPRAPRALQAAALAGMAFLHVPMLFIFLYAFSSEDQTYVFPPPGLTTHWFGVAWERPDVWQAIELSLQVATVTTMLALVLGTLAALALARTRFFGREAVSLLLVHLKKRNRVSAAGAGP